MFIYIVVSYNQNFSQIKKNFLFFQKHFRHLGDFSSFFAKTLGALVLNSF